MLLLRLFSPLDTIIERSAKTLWLAPQLFRASEPYTKTKAPYTLDRILIATETRLVNHHFQGFRIHEIIRQAQTSTGSFYARFQDKNALLTALTARYDATLPARAAAWQTRNGPAPTTLSGAALWTARSVAHSFRARRNLLRSLALQVRQHPELADESLRVRRVAQHAFLIEALVRAGAQPAAAQTALFFAVSICRERILFSDTPPARSVAESDAELVGDVGRMVVVGGFGGLPHGPCGLRIRQLSRNHKAVCNEGADGTSSFL